MNKICFIIILSFSLLGFSQELRQEKQAHRPFEHYLYRTAKMGSLVIPPLYTTYKILACEGAACPELHGLAAAGLAWIGGIIIMNKLLMPQSAECSVYDLHNLISKFPEVVDSIDSKKVKYFYSCAPDKFQSHKFSFSFNELEKMFGRYITHYCIDGNDKPFGRLIINSESITHPLITAWAQNQYYRKFW